MGIATFFKGMLSSDKIVDAGVKAGDAIWYTKEEKAQDAMKHKELMIRYIEASMPMNVSRRFIAIAVTCAWLFCGLIELILILLHSYKVESIHAFNTIYVMPPFTVVVSFYFFKRMATRKEGK